MLRRENETALRTTLTSDNAIVGHVWQPSFDTLFWPTIEINDYPNVWFVRMVISEFTLHDLARIS